MQKTFLVLAVVALLAACGQGRQDDKVPDVPSESGDLPIVPDSILILLHNADLQVHRYHESVNFHPGDDTPQVSFMLDAISLRNYLNANDSFVKLDVYLGKNDEGQLGLIYVGATKVNDSEYREHPYLKTNENGEQVPHMLNHALPCPKCDRIKLIGPPHSSH